MSLRVEPAALNQGASELRQYQTQLRDAIATIAAEYTQLKESWTGVAADHASTVWDELHPRLNTHIEKLGQHASLLASAASEFTAEDQQSAKSIAATSLTNLS